VTLNLVPGGGTVCSDNTVATGTFRVGIDAAAAGINNGLCPDPDPDGDADSTGVVRAFVAFLRAPIPTGATVLSAILTAQRVQSGTPYPSGQQLLVEATPWVATGGGLDPLDFIVPNLAGTPSVAVATTPGTTLVVDIRSLVQAYVSLGAMTVDLRLRLSNEALAAGDYDELIPGTVTLQVTYRP
jgi:hypothetical protein